MNRYFKYLGFLFILSLFANKSDGYLVVKFHSKSCKPNIYNQLTQRNNDNAVQIEMQYHFVENSNFSEGFKSSKIFSKYNTTSLHSKSLFFSSLIKLNEKILNSNLVYFSDIQIIYPFHSFW